MDVRNFKFVVIGAGFSGMVFAERVSSVLKESVLVIEKRKEIGGNAFDYKEGNVTVQQYGPHIFHTESEKAWRYLSNFTDWILYKHRVKAFVKGEFIPLPFNFSGIDILFPANAAEEYKKALEKEFGYGSKVPIFELESSKNEKIKKLADFIYENIFLNYTTKQWGVPPDKIDRSVISRVPVNLSYEDTYFTDTHQGIPRNGFSKIFRKMAESKKITVLTNTDFSDLFDINLKKKKIFLKNGEEFKGYLVYTGRADELFKFEFGKLSYRTLDFAFEKHNKEFYQKVAVVNYPNDYEFTRITEFKHFYNESAPYTIIAKEFPEEFKEGKIPYYPVPNGKNKETYAKYETEAKKFKNLIMLGRLANFKYINMDEAVLNSMKAFEEL